MEMAVVRQNFAEYLKSLRALYLALLAGQLLSLAVCYTLHPSRMELLPDDGMAVRIPVLIVVLFISGFFLGRNRVRAASRLPDLKEKMMAFRAAALVRWALIEGGVLVAAIFFFLSRNLLLFIAALAGSLLFLMFTPARNRIIGELGLSAEDQAMLDDPGFIVAEFDRVG